MEETKDKKSMKNLSIIVLACIVSTCSVFMGNTAGLPEYFGNIVGMFIIFSIIVYVIDKICSIEIASCTIKKDEDNKK